MSGFWAGWVMFLVVLNLGITFFLFVWAQRVRIPTDADGTSGHRWAHGVLREGVRRLPRWWVVMSALMFAGAFGYLVLYPGFGSFGGMLGWTSAEQHARATAANDARLEPVMQVLQSDSIVELAGQEAVRDLGRVLFLDNCAACHARDARGNRALGAPNLTDSDWLYGGDPQTVLASILDGRHGTMPAWGAALGQDGVVDVAAYVRSLGGADEPAKWVETGKARFATLCAGCHGIDGRGTPALGAPNLSDDVWLYGGDLASVTRSIRDGRGGVMPAWRERLGEEQVRAVAAWVYANAESANEDRRSRASGR